VCSTLKLHLRNCGLHKLAAGAEYWRVRSQALLLRQCELLQTLCACGQACHQRAYLERVAAADITAAAAANATLHASGSCLSVILCHQRLCRSRRLAAKLTSQHLSGRSRCARSDDYAACQVFVSMYILGVFYVEVALAHKNQLQGRVMAGAHPQPLCHTWSAR
jgi:hypothetical protein